MPTHCGRKFAESPGARRGRSPSLTIRCLAVQIADEQVQRLQPLAQPGLGMRRHSRRGDDARNDVERPGAVDVRALAVDREGDPHLLDGDLGRLLAGADFVSAHLGQAARHHTGHGARASRPGHHVVEEALRVVGLPVDRCRGAAAPEFRGHDRERKGCANRRPPLDGAGWPSGCSVCAPSGRPAASNTGSSRAWLRVLRAIRHLAASLSTSSVHAMRVWQGGGMSRLVIGFLTNAHRSATPSLVGPPSVCRSPPRCC